MRKKTNPAGIAPAAVNGANEQAVKLFLEGKIGFLQIAELVEAALADAENKKDFSIEDIFLADKQARQAVINSVSR